MQRRRGAGPRREGDPDGSGAIDEHAAPIAAATATTPSTSAGPATVLRKPRHGGWKGTEPGREEQMLRGEPGYHLGGCPYQAEINLVSVGVAIEVGNLPRERALETCIVFRCVTWAVTRYTLPVSSSFALHYHRHTFWIRN